MLRIHPELSERKLSILLVDDSIVQVKLRRRTVENFLNFDRYKFEIVVAEDGEEAIRKFEENKFDIVITDFSMPNKNGVELIKHIRNKEFMSHEDNPAKIMIVTTNDLEDLNVVEGFDDISASIRRENKDNIQGKLIDFMENSLREIEEERPGYLDKVIAPEEIQVEQSSQEVASTETRSPSTETRVRSFSDIAQSVRSAVGRIFGK